MFAHPAFDHYRHWLAADRAPDLALLNAFARRIAHARDGQGFRFVAGAACNALQYESRIANRGEITLRPDSLHDVCNALVWLAFPRTKAALNALHVNDRAGVAGRRSGRRDAATLLDESGLILACADDRLVALLRAHAWRELFVTRRDHVAAKLRAVACGHGLLARMVAPYRAITGRALVVSMSVASLPRDAAGWARVDVAAASQVATPDFATGFLLPLPVAALQGWDTEGLGDRLFDDAAVFRRRVLA